MKEYNYITEHIVHRSKCHCGAARHWKSATKKIDNVWYYWICMQCHRTIISEITKFRNHCISSYDANHLKAKEYLREDYNIETSPHYTDDEHFQKEIRAS